MNRLATIAMSVAALMMSLAAISPHAYSRLTILPSDDTAGGGSGDIYWFMNFGSNQSAWPTLNNCLSSSGGVGSHRNCVSTSAPDARNGTIYFGQAFVRYLICSPMEDHLSWGSAADLSLAVYEVQGSSESGGTEDNFVRNKLGGDVSFDETDGVGVSKRVVINLPTTLSGGYLQVKFSVVGSEPSVPTDNGFSCIIALTE